MFSKILTNGIEMLTMETDHLAFSIVPALGGKIWSIYNKQLGKQFLWTNSNLPLQMQERGADYDSNFLGAIDELIPNDMTETIDSIDYPDHGELWTTPLQYFQTEDKITVHGHLALSGLHYSKTVYADANSPMLYMDYTIKNTTNEQRNFLWKLHAALRIEAGDQLLTNAQYGQVVDPTYSRFKDTNPFIWPIVEDTNASIIPSKGNAIDFFYLYNIPAGEMQLLSNEGKHVFSYQCDIKVFPYQWYFASYGGFFDHYTAILEPCTNMPMSVNEAKEKRQCAVLAPGETLHTSVRIYAGEKQ
ncbi:DUF5107 domain-containing protein [Ilyomonas limi]|uniref:DUF5107 domain-containing protein n=1 Tax=Ilyomonas limi TaxID=2575867 RepID=A0A4U3L8W1_9BACT|nr:DUF5107 domain-containing protein [Ilyomonas limi]TKK70137.1 DUF5107 domain-containing protein [Ilyomonas limi]